jgi:hypothetical protein
MNIISETINQYYFGVTKVVQTTEEDEEGYLYFTKKIYFAGIKIFQSSERRRSSIADAIMQAWGGKVE